MSVKRKQIRHRIIDLIRKSKVVKPDRVWGNRFRAVQEDDELPLVLVYSGDEKISRWAEAPREYERKLQIRIEVIISGGDDLDDDLDLLCQRIENVLDDDHTLGELAEDVILMDVEQLQNPDGSTMIAAARLTFEVTYYSMAVAITEDDVPKLPEAETVHTSYRAPIVGEAKAEASDETDLNP